MCEATGEIVGEQTIEVFMYEDIESLKSLFNKKMYDKYDLDVEILKLFDYMDGEIVSYGAILFFKKGLRLEQLSSNPGHATKKLI